MPGPGTAHSSTASALKSRVYSCAWFKSASSLYSAQLTVPCLLRPAFATVKVTRSFLNRRSGDRIAIGRGNARTGFTFHHGTPDTSATAALAPPMPPPAVLAAWSAGPEPSQLEAAEVALSAFKVSFHEQHGREPVYAELKLERVYRDWRRIHRAAKRMAALTGGKPVTSLEAKPSDESAAERRSCISVVKVHVDTADSAGEMGLSDGAATKEAEGDDGGEGFKDRTNYTVDK